MTPKKKKRLSGAAQVKKRGQLPVLVGLKPEEKEAIQRAADITRQSMAAFIALHAAKAARDIIFDHD